VTTLTEVRYSDGAAISKLHCELAPKKSYLCHQIFYMDVKSWFNKNKSQCKSEEEEITFLKSAKGYTRSHKIKN
jgi:hypothetical protein